MSQTSSESKLTQILNSSAKAPLFSRILLILQLSLPAILSQISSVVMQYIDTSMAGSLGANDSASIGLMSSSIWLVCSLGIALNYGFSVQAAQYIGAQNNYSTRSVLKLGFLISGAFSIVLLAIGCLVYKDLPYWLGANKEIADNASIFFLIFMLAIPFMLINHLAGIFIQSSGNMKIPSILNILMCVLDVIFNFLLIFPSHNIQLWSFEIYIPGADLGVAGAALGTALAEVITCLLMLLSLFTKISAYKPSKPKKTRIHNKHLIKALRISFPIGIDHLAMCGALVVSTIIVSPLGTFSIAAHSFAITAESFCYMAGYGISSACTAIIGQSIGARREDYAISFSWIANWLGVAFMTITGIIMFIIAPNIMSFLTPVPEIQKLGTEVLRIEAFAEPFYAASIVIAGALRGAGDTFVPSCLNIFSMWVVRLPLSLVLSWKYGLQGVWIAMCLELCVRGTLFLFRLHSKKWLKTKKI